jgi:glutamate synthase domain-containing protein 2
MYQKTNDVLGTINRGNPCESGLCTLCRADCSGKCETFLSSLIGRKMLYPRDFGTVTAGSTNINHIGACYNNLRIHGGHYGSCGIQENLTNSADDCIFPNVSIETSFGDKVKTKVKVPVMTGALGSTFIAAKYWDSFAIGASLVGFPIVVGENVVGIDKKAVIENGHIKVAPELDRRIETYLRYYDGYGAIIVQMNVEDTRNGVAEYVINKYGDKVIMELKWGQGAKNIGGEIQVSDIEYAKFLKDRGYVVDPNPYEEAVEEGYKNGSIKSFARHSRLGYTDINDYETLRESFMSSVTHLRALGYKRITLKTGAYGMEGLATAIKLASEAHLDLLTIDGSGGGTGMSPWNMMETWGIPSLHLHSKTYEYAQLMKSNGQHVVDMAFAGGLAREDHIFKALALGGEFTKLVCMGRALMIPAFVGSNIEGVLKPERKSIVNGNWSKLPPWMENEIGVTVEELFAGYFDLQKKIGKSEMKNIPYGAIGVWTLADKLSAGLQQLLAGARKFSVNEISRNDIWAANKETAEITGITMMTQDCDDVAKKILLS